MLIHIGPQVLPESCLTHEANLRYILTLRMSNLRMYLHIYSIYDIISVDTPYYLFIFQTKDNIGYLILYGIM